MDKNDRAYSNGEITVYWKPKECIHATICYAKLIEVFNPRKRPWVNMYGAPTAKIIDIVDQCPTNALTYKWNNEISKEEGDRAKDKERELASKPVEIQVIQDGPMLVTGKIKITSEEGKEFPAPQITSFCRCGASSNMPFCDGTHRKIGFKG
jgi:uncharacterized Fe-S cluster protein YjdI